MSTESDAIAMLKEYVAEFPAFRSMPMGAPNSRARAEQEADIAREDKAKAIIAKAEGRTP